LNGRCFCLAASGWNRIAVRRLSEQVPIADIEDHLQRIAAMKTITVLLAAAALMLAAGAAEAKGCLKGAAVGGVAGHYAGHHGVIGAIAGCAYGRHRAKEQARQQQDPNTPPPAGQEKM
jgi:hypothetical protein